MSAVTPDSMIPATAVTAATSVTTTTTTATTTTTTPPTAAAAAVHSVNDKPPGPHNQVELSLFVTYLFFTPPPLGVEYREEMCVFVCVCP